MKKRFVAIALVLLALANLTLAGCGGSEETSTDAGIETGADVSTDENEKVKLTIGIPQNASVTSYDDNAFTKYLEEKANVELEFVFFPSSGDDYVRQLTLMAAANEEMPDVLCGFNGLNNNVRNEFGESGYLMDLTDLIDKYAPDYKAALEKLSEHDRDRIVSRATASDGSIYALPLFLDMQIWDDLQTMLFINQTWLDNLGLEQPKTVDELYTVLKAFKEKDPNGNGVADEIPMFGKTNLVYNITTWIINACVYYNDTYDLNVTDGKLWAPYVTDEYRQALIFLNKLCREGLLSDLSFSAGTAEMKAMVTPSTEVAQVGIWAGHPSVYTDPTSPILEQYEPFAGLEDETGKGGYIVMTPKTLAFPLMITADCDDPEAAMRFLNVFYQDETITRQRHGEKDVDWVEEEGELSFGGTGHIKQLDSTVFFKGNHTWCVNVGGVLTPQNYLPTRNHVKHSDEVVSQLSLHCYQNVISKVTQPDEVCEDLIYSPEQYELRAQYRSTLIGYILEQRNLFILGTIDPNDDLQWQNYLTELDRQGLNAYIDVMQEAYEDNLGN